MYSVFAKRWRKKKPTGKIGVADVGTDTGSGVVVVIAGVGVGDSGSGRNRLFDLAQELLIYLLRKG